MPTKNIYAPSRRSVMLGLATGGFLATPAAAQLGFSMGGGAAGDLFETAIDVMQSMNISEEDELAMGNAYYERFINQSGGRYNCRAAQEALHAFAKPVIAHSSRSGLPWDITLVNNETVNAWALPGGKMAIYKGLLRYTATPEELAAVISHEVGHIEHRHAIAQMKNKQFTKSMGGVAKKAIVNRVSRGGAGAVGGFVTGEVLTALEAPIYGMMASGYSRELEYVADEYIIDVFQANGYSCSRAPTVLETMMRLIPKNTKETTSLYSTHPGTKDRIERLEKKIAKLESSTVNETVPPGWAELKRSFPTRKNFRLAS